MNILETNEKMESPSKELENIKKKLMEISELKNTLTKFKTHQKGSVAKWR